MTVVRLFLMYVLVAATAATAATPASPPQADAAVRIRAVLQLRFPDVKIEAIKPAPVAGLYEVFTAEEIVYVDASGEYMLTGKMLSVSTKRDLTAQSWSEHNRIDFAALPLDAAIKTVRGKGTRKLAVFSDPHCPYCKNLEKELATLDDVTVYAFLYPLEKLHKGATESAHNIWCSADRAAAWSAWMIEAKQPAAAECANDPVSRNLELGTRFKINSTPTVFFADGSRITGARPAAELEKLLGGRSAPNTAAASR